MARGFGSTLGAGTTDRMTIDTAFVQPANLSIFVKINTHGTAGVPRVWATDNASFRMQGFNTPPWSYYFNFPYTTSEGQWRADAPSLDAWHTILVTHSFSGAPTVYIDGSSVTLEETITPVGTRFTGSQSNFYLGNRASSAGVHDGMLAEFAMWDRILTASEAAALGKDFSPLHFPQNRIKYVPMIRANYAIPTVPSITGTAVQDHPRLIPPRRGY